MGFGSVPGALRPSGHCSCIRECGYSVVPLSSFDIRHSTFLKSMLRLLVIDAYSDSGRAALDSVASTRAGVLYERAISAEVPAAEINVVECSPRGPELPAGTNLGDYDGVVWTGSNLTIHKPDELVRQQIELARAAFKLGVPQFGSCWAAQLAARRRRRLGRGAGGRLVPRCCTPPRCTAAEYQRGD